MISDRLTPERMLLMDGVEKEGEGEVARTSELGFVEYDSWKGVEGSVEAVLSAISFA
jgi:hypothetical protein